MVKKQRRLTSQQLLIAVGVDNDEIIESVSETSISELISLLNSPNDSVAMASAVMLYTRKNEILSEDIKEIKKEYEKAINYAWLFSIYPLGNAIFLALTKNPKVFVDALILL